MSKAKIKSENEISHRRLRINGVCMHIAEQGSGPLVILLHGFPEFWYSWRHQIGYLADRGYHVVAPDLRGYGDSDAPPSPFSYTVIHLVGDIIALMNNYGEQKAVVAGHDWGAVIGWCLCLFRPERVRGFISLCVPLYHRNQYIRTVETSRRAFGNDFYVCQFQEPGRAEKAFARYDHLTVMKKFLLITKTDNLIAPPNMELIDSLETPAELPAWITEEELQCYADKFQATGFTGPLNYYRAMNMNWELLAPWQGRTVDVPTKFMVGDKDFGFEINGIRRYVTGEFKNIVPNLEVVILDGHHYIHQEKAQEVSEEIVSFLRKLESLDI